MKIKRKRIKIKKEVITGIDLTSEETEGIEKELIELFESHIGYKDFPVLAKMFEAISPQKHGGLKC